MTNKCKVSISFLYLGENKLIVKYTLNFVDVLLDKDFIFLSTLSMALPFQSMSTGLSMPCLLHHVSIQSLSHTVMVDLAFSDEILLVYLYLEPLVNNFVSLLFSRFCQSPVTACWWSIKPESTQLYDKMEFFWRMTLKSRLERNLWKIEILDLIGFVCKYTHRGIGRIFLKGGIKFLKLLATMVSRQMNF